MAQRHKKSLASADADIVTVIAHEIRIAGRIHGQEDIRVHGTLEGSVMLSGGALHVEKRGVVLADVQAERVFVSGIVVGDLTAQDRVVLYAGARVVGDISTQRLVIEPGAAVRGNIATSDSPAPVEREQEAEAEIPKKTSASRASGARKSSAAAVEVVTPAPKKTTRRAKKATIATKRAVRATSSRSSTASTKKKKAAKKKAARPRMPSRGKHRAARS